MAYRMTDDSVTVRGKGHPKYSGKSVTRRGENVVATTSESGRRDAGTQEGPDTSSGRPASTSTARDVTGVNPLNPIDPKMPNLR